MTDRHLFLFGGSPPFSDQLGKMFSDLAFQRNGQVALLFIERDGWEHYMSTYTEVLEIHGILNFVYLPLSEISIVTLLDSCTGIIICGGETELYHKYLVGTPTGIKIKEMYERGVPVAGFSAGAIVSPENCVIPPIDNSANEHLFLQGLGLIKDCVISVHFCEWREEDNLKKSLLKNNVSIGYGIDDGSGIYFLNGDLAASEGYIVYLKQLNR